MNTAHAVASPFARYAPLAVTADLALALPGIDGDAVDEDWLEFLSLAAPVDAADALAGGGWRHAPVLLSY